MSEQPKFFQQHAKTENPKPKGNSHLRKTFWQIGIAMFVFLIVGYFVWQLFLFGRQFADNWKEVLFAAEKPKIVHTLRIQYETKQTALDKQFITPSSQQAMQDQVRQTVTEVLQEQKAPPAPSFR